MHMHAIHNLDAVSQASCGTHATQNHAASIKRRRIQCRVGPEMPAGCTWSAVPGSLQTNHLTGTVSEATRELQGVRRSTPCSWVAPGQLPQNGGELRLRLQPARQRERLQPRGGAGQRRGPGVVQLQRQVQVLYRCKPWGQGGPVRGNLRAAGLHAGFPVLRHAEITLQVPQACAGGQQARGELVSL